MINSPARRSRSPKKTPDHIVLKAICVAHKAMRIEPSGETAARAAATDMLVYRISHTTGNAQLGGVH